MPESHRHTRIETPRKPGWLPTEELHKAIIDIRRYVETAQVFSRADILAAIDKLTEQKYWTPIVRRQQTALMRLGKP